MDASGNVYVANEDNTVSVFAPGSTTAAATLTGLNGPGRMAFDADGNLYVVNYDGGAGTTVSEFAPGGTTPMATIRGLHSPYDLAFDAPSAASLWPTASASSSSLQLGQSPLAVFQIG